MGSEHRFYGADGPGFCVVCQEDFTEDDELYSGPCLHSLHRWCAEAYVRSWRMEQPPSRAPPCPTCNCESAFGLHLFRWTRKDAAEKLERSREKKREQEALDLTMARALNEEGRQEFVLVHGNMALMISMAVRNRMLDEAGWGA